MSRGTQLLAGSLAGMACLLLALAAGATTAAAVHHEHVVHGPVVLVSTTDAFGTVLLLAARLLGSGLARGGDR
ncbi:hypothetical protein GCM10010430_43720 [Kitasatospora cystarginea]|uniref:Uncharacterized protein n=1 Tax=Kitasatospora cystarginea TaxID=58350 RepID=A0ABN3EDL2_9ACTN